MDVLAVQEGRVRCAGLLGTAVEWFRGEAHEKLCDGGVFVTDINLECGSFRV